MPGWINEADVLRQLRSAGLIIEDGIELAKSDGRSRRCRVDGMDREKRGWYRLSEWVTREGVMLVGTYGIFSGADAGTRKIELSKQCESCHAEIHLKDKTCPHCGAKTFKSREMSPEELAAMKARQAEQKKAAEAERKAEIARAARWAAAVWRVSQECTPADHDYFARKHLDQSYGTRIYPGNDALQVADLEGAEDDDWKYLGTFKGALVIPMCDAGGSVYGVQFILSRQHHAERIRRTGRDKDFWPTGMQLEGRYFIIGGTPGPVAGVAEGFATGVSVLNAMNAPVAVAFVAGNLLPALTDLRKRYKRTRFLIAADDDWLMKCNACGQYTTVETDLCQHCGQPHMKANAGKAKAAAAALAVPDVAYVLPTFATRPTDKKGPTDFNDLHTIESLNTARSQIETRLEELGWLPLLARPGQGAGSAPASAAGSDSGGAGDGARRNAVSTMPIDDVVQRFIYVDDDTGDFAFDTWTKQVVKLTKVIKLLPARVRFDDVKDHPVWKSRAVYIDQIGFDPGGEDPNIVCNRWSGWPTTPKRGDCQLQLDLLRYLCSNEPTASEVYHWILCWMAWPLQHPGAKLKSALVIHGPQGTGKSMVFEAYAKIYADYGLILNQGAIEDKFNADWSERKLFILADEIVARAEMHHLKNQLKNLITGEWVRVNPKNVAAHRERNHMNIVFSSNEDQPVVLEDKDRRHLVLWTPPKLPPEVYENVIGEIENGGIAALHHHLLNYDVGDWRPWHHPPMTKAKQSLIDISADSIERFLGDWQHGDIDGIPFCPCGSGDLYKLYLRWCRDNGEKFPRTSAQFMGRLEKREGWFKGHKDRLLDLNHPGTTRVRVVIPSETALMEAAKSGEDWRKKPDKTLTQWISEAYFAFNQAINKESA